MTIPRSSTIHDASAGWRPWDRTWLSSTSPVAGRTKSRSVPHRCPGVDAKSASCTATAPSANHACTVAVDEGASAVPEFILARDLVNRQPSACDLQ